MNSPMLQPNGTRFGGWLLNTADKHVLSLTWPTSTGPAAARSSRRACWSWRALRIASEAKGPLHFHGASAATTDIVGANRRGRRGRRPSHVRRARLVSRRTEATAAPLSTLWPPGLVLRLKGRQTRSWIRSAPVVVGLAREWACRSAEGEGRHASRRWPERG